MADEPLVKETLTEEMIKAGAELTRRLDEAKWPVVASFWYFVPEQNQWKLVFASPKLLSHGPAHAYYTIRLASGALHEQVPSLKQIVVVAPRDEVVQALGLAIETGWKISGIRFSHNTINGRFIEDAFIYRLTQPRLSDRPIWFDPTPELEALDKKTVRIKERDIEWDGTMSVERANPESPEAGKYSIKASVTSGEVKWVEGGGPIPTSQIFSRQKFLNEAAVKVVDQYSEEPGRLLLDVS